MRAGLRGDHHQQTVRHSQPYRVHGALAVGRRLNFSHQVNHMIDPKTLELYDHIVRFDPTLRRVTIIRLDGESRETLFTHL